MLRSCVVSLAWLLLFLSALSRTFSKLASSLSRASAVSAISPMSFWRCDICWPMASCCLMSWRYSLSPSAVPRMKASPAAFPTWAYCFCRSARAALWMSLMASMSLQALSMVAAACSKAFSMSSPPAAVALLNPWMRRFVSSKTSDSLSLAVISNSSDPPFIVFIGCSLH